MTTNENGEEKRRIHDEQQGQEQKENVMISNEEEKDMVVMVHEEEEQPEEDDVPVHDAQEKEEEEEDDDDDFCSIPPTANTPYLVFHHDEKIDPKLTVPKLTFYSLSEGTDHFVRSVPEISGMYITGFSHGWVVMGYHTSNKKSLLNPISMEFIHLPPLKVPKYSTRCALSSSPPDCVVMFLVDDDGSCTFCRLGDKKWIKILLGIPSMHMFRSEVVSCQGRIYVTFFDRGAEGIAVFEFKSHQIVGDVAGDDYDTKSNHAIEKISKCNTDSSSNPITIQNNIKYVYNSRNMRNTFTVEKIRLEPNKEVSTFHKNYTAHYLVESCGEVFMFFVVEDTTTNTYGVVHSIDVFKLNTSIARWEDVRTLGEDRLFFYRTDCVVSFPALKLGLKENHIYYSVPGDECLNTYNMVNKRFSACRRILASKTAFFLGCCQASYNSIRDQIID